MEHSFQGSHEVMNRFYRQAEMKQSSLFKCQKTKLWNTVFEKVMYRFRDTLK